MKKEFRQIMQTKTAPSFFDLNFIGFKAMDDKPGWFSGHLAVFNNVDYGLDRIKPGAFKKTLVEAEARRKKDGGPYMLPILWQHNPHEPIGGFLVMQEDAVGLYVEGEIDLDIPEGHRAYSGLKKGYLKGLSIGYDAMLETWEKGIRNLLELRLWEGSVVTFPMNPLAGVEGVKAQVDLSFERQIELVWEAVRMVERIPYSDGDGDHARYYLMETYAGYCIAEDSSTGGYVKFPWVMGENGVVVGAPEAVERVYQPIQKAKAWAMILRATTTGPADEKAGRRHSAGDCELIRAIHKSATDLMDETDREQALKVMVDVVSDDTLKSVMSTLDDTRRASIFGQNQPGDGPDAKGAHPNQTPTGEGKQDGPDDSTRLAKQALDLIDNLSTEMRLKSALADLKAAVPTSKEGK